MNGAKLNMLVLVGMAIVSLIGVYVFDFFRDRKTRRLGRDAGSIQSGAPPTSSPDTSAKTRA